jgi:phenylacetic acid degradation operon negative regulatory protein
MTSLKRALTMAAQTPSLRSQDLVFTLYGDYLLGLDRPVWTGSLISLLGRVGLSPMAVRTVLSRMARKGWLSVERASTRSFYGLTRKGRKLLSEGRERIYHPPRDEAWEGSWTLISYQIPEARRPLRDQLRVRLLWLGCGPLGNGLWITPHDVRREVEEIAGALRLARHVEVFRATHVGHSDLTTLVSRCWDLKAINQRYAAFMAKWEPLLLHCSHCGTTGARPVMYHLPDPPFCADPAECFSKRFLLVHEFRLFPFEDPFLPKPLLPEDWKGGQAAALFEAYHEQLRAPAERYVAEVCRAGWSEEDDAKRQAV